MKKITSIKGRITLIHLVKPVSLLFFIVLCATGFSQQMFTWMRGSSAVNQMGSYGTMGVASAFNDPGGREAPATWKDANGNLWLFGGYSYDSNGNPGLTNDVWKYSISTNQWTWMRGDNAVDPMGVYGTIGVSSSNNDPGGREAASYWVDASGNFWLFGGIGWDDSFNIGELNDLWKYNVATNEWTWMSGSSSAFQGGTYGTLGVAAAANVPGARYGCFHSVDATGNLWLFGGLGDDANGSVGDLNDLWRYNTSTNQWTWMSGSNVVDQSGVYGTVNVPAATNVPGGRYLGTSWTDNSGNFWVTNGFGYDANSGFEDILNDLWKYNISTGQWTWMSGSNISYQNGNYGTIGIPAASNVPGARYGSIAWKDFQGNLMMFGGEGIDANSNTGNLNDLWKFDLITNQWTWTHGTGLYDEPGLYGVQGVPSANNFPGARVLSCTWVDNSSNLWLFGGPGIDDQLDYGLQNDLWKFSACIVSPTVAISSSTPSFCIGGSNTLTANGAASYLWSNNQTTSVTVITPANAGVTTISVTPMDLDGCVGSSTTAVSFTAYAYPVATLSSTSPTFCLGGSSTITATGAVTYSWSTSQTGSVVSVSPNTPGVTTLTVYPSSNGCSNSATISVTAYALPSLTTTSSKMEICKGETVTLTGSGATNYTWTSSTATTVGATAIVISPSNTIIYTLTGKNANGCMSTAVITQSVSECTGIAKNTSASIQYNLYPNPNNGAFTISGPHFGNTTQLVIYNVLGQKVSTQQMDTEQTKIQADLPKGMYNYSVMDNDQTISSGKIIIE